MRYNADGKVFMSEGSDEIIERYNVDLDTDVIYDWEGYFEDYIKRGDPGHKRITLLLFNKQERVMLPWTFTLMGFGDDDDKSVAYFMGLGSSDVQIKTRSFGFVQVKNPPDWHEGKLTLI